MSDNKVLGADIVIEDNGSIVLDKFEKSMDKLSTSIDNMAKMFLRLDDKINDLVKGVKVADQVLGNDLPQAGKKAEKVLGAELPSATERAIKGFGKIQNTSGGTVKGLSSVLFEAKKFNKTVGSELPQATERAIKGFGKIKNTSGGTVKGLSAVVFESKKVKKAIGDDLPQATNKGMRGMDKIKSTATKVMSRISLMSQKATSSASKMKSSFDKVVPSLKKIGSTAGSVLGKVTKLATATAAVGVGGVTAAGVGILKSGAELERYGVSMKHFIGIQNKNMTEAQVSKAADNYVDNLKDYAQNTPFETSDILASGTRMLQITTGDSESAYKYLKMAGDMAALTDGKSVMDAVEALADAKVGEFERMKEFGVKVSAEEFKGYVGKGKNDDLTEAEMEKAFMIMMEKRVNSIVKGGAEELSNTASGKWSKSISGIKQSFADMGLDILEKMNKNGSMDKLVKLSERFAKSIDGISDKIADLANKGFDWLLEKGDKAMTGIEKMMKGFGSDIEALLAGEKSFGDIISEWIDKAKDPVKTGISTVIQWIINAISDNKDLIADAAMDIGGAIFKGIIEGFFGAINETVPGMKELSESPGIKNHKSANETYMNSLGYSYDPETVQLRDMYKNKKMVSGKPTSIMYNNTATLTTTSNWKNSSSELIQNKKAVGGKIPYDNYPALLHEGEVVLTKQQVNQTKNNNRSVTVYMTNNFSKDTDDEVILSKLVKRLNIALGD